MKRLLLLVTIIIGGILYYQYNKTQINDSVTSRFTTTIYSTNEVNNDDDGVSSNDSNKTEIENDYDERPNEVNITNANNPNKQELKTPPTQKKLENNYHIYQTFNNCGPSSLSMALSYFDINVSQKTLGDELRPYQVSNGNNDDKSVTVEELAKKAEEYGFNSYFRPNGDIEIIKYAITYDLPVIVKTWMSTTDDTGHYRVVKGYDESRGVIIQDDSMQGPNLEFTYDEFNKIWKKFNYEFLIIAPDNLKNEVEAFLGDNLNEKRSWGIAFDTAFKQIQNDPSDIDARFNLIVAAHNIQDYQTAVNEYEKIEDQIKLKRLWYQIEPISSYYHLNNYDKVFSISERVLSSGNRAYSELYLLRGYSYLELGDTQKAKNEFEKALQYNKNLLEAKEALKRVN